MTEEIILDTAHSALITDHPYKSTQKNLLCDKCGLGQATHSHKKSKVYKTSVKTPYRCPDCVTKGVSPCQHTQ